MLPKISTPDEESPEDKLIHTLIEYDKIQKISKLLQVMEKNTLLLWKREEISENFDNREFNIEEVSTFQLAEIFLNIIKKREQDEYLYLQSKDFSIEHKIEEILKLIETNQYLDFFAYIEKLDSLEEMLKSFFALLEMVRKRLVVAIQKKIFDTISVWKRPENSEV